MATTVRGKAGEDSNQLILPARKRKKPSTAGSSSSGAAAAAPPMSKSQAKKLRKLAEKKEKEKRRAALYASLEATKLAGSHAALLQSSSKVGQKETTRERLKSELRRERMGVAMPAAAQQQEASRMDKKRRRELKKAEAEAASEAALEEARIRQAAERAEKAAQEARAAAAAAAAASSSSCAGGAAGAASAGVRSALPCAPLVTDLGAMRSKQVAPTSVAAKLARKAKRGSSAPAFYVQVNRDPDMQAARMALPVCGMEQEIMEAVAENDVVIICGETGSGKTTQVPQFLYEAGFGAPAPGGIQGMIGVTQPRRVAAVSVAKRVAEELNVDMDAAAAAAAKKASASASPASDGRRQVAYQVRYDAREVGSATRVKFMTDGILLREVQEDLLLRKYSALVLDEAHERNMNTDILLGFLSRIVPLRARLAASPDGGRKENDGKPLPRLKLIIMSATLRVADFAENSTLFPVAPPVIHVKARQHPVTVHHSRRTEMADYERAVYRRVCQIHRRLPQGGILVFMTGKQEIETLCRRLRDRFAKDGDTAATKGSRRTAARAGGRSGHDGVEDTNEFDEDELQGDGLLDDLEDEEAEAAAREEEEAKEDEDEDAPTIASLADAAAKKAGADDKEEEEEEEEEKEEEDGSACPYEGVHVLPLYSMLPPDAQLAVFADPPSGMRPIVVATNVAETSITIPGMKYVVDSGREKIRQCEGTSGVSRFEVGWVSKASAAQRAGRAGRTGPGHCYRMYSSAVFENQFVDFAEPEMRRRPVEDVILRMKRMHVDDVVGFPFPIPPHRTALESAQRGLRRIGALRPTRQGEQLTSLGSSLADIPLGVRYAKMVVLAKAHAKRTKDQDFLKLALAMVAGMSVQNPLLQGAAKTAGAEDAEGGTGAVGDAGAGAQGSVADGLAGDATEKSGPDHSRWRNERSDALSLLRVIGAYSHATKGRLRPRHSDAKAFCNEHSLHAKVGRLLHGGTPLTVLPSFRSVPGPTAPSSPCLHFLVCLYFLTIACGSFSPSLFLRVSPLPFRRHVLGIDHGGNQHAPRAAWSHPTGLAGDG